MLAGRDVYVPGGKIRRETWYSLTKPILKKVQIIGSDQISHSLTKLENLVSLNLSLKLGNILHTRPHGSHVVHLELIFQHAPVQYASLHSLRFTFSSFCTLFNMSLSPI